MITTERFFLRPLSVEDVTPRYLGWFGAPGSERISAAADMTSLEKLTDYVREKSAREDVLFLGIFERQTHQHIGNIKFEPIMREEGCAVFGILIGEEGARGRGVTGEVLQACGAWLRENLSIREIVLGVATDNHAAIRAYEKVGFRIGKTGFIDEHPGIHQMIWTIG